MKVARSGLTVLFLALAALCSGSVVAQAQTFTFQVCNKSTLTGYVAVAAHVAPGDDRFQVSGWWAVNAGDCSTIGNFPLGWFYYYADATNGDWHGSDVMVCVQHPGPFQRINTQGYTCQNNETLVGFNGEQVTTSGTFTWTLNP